MNPTERVHPADEQLLAELHGEAAPGVAAHLANCVVCSERSRMLAADDATVATLLAALDHSRPSVAFAPIRARRMLRRGLLVAASAATLAVAAAALVPVSPLHRWITAPSAGVVPAAAKAAASQHVAATAGDAATSGIAVQPSGVVVVMFRHDPASGVLELDRSATAEVGLRARGGRTGYRVESDRIVIDNQQAAETYFIDIPAGLTRLVVKDAGGVLLTWPDDSARWAAPGAAPVRVPLDRLVHHGR